MPTFNFHSRTLLLMSRDAALRARADRASDSIAAILLAAASTEAFVNELAEYVVAVCALPLHAAEILPPIASAARIIMQLEVNRRSVTDKYYEGANAFGGQPLSRGSAIFQELKRLHDLRGSIMHVKLALDPSHRGTRQTNILAARRIAIPQTPFGLPWFERLMVPSTAKWAHDSARDIMRAFVERMPVREYYDPFENERRMLREHPECW